MKIIKLLLLFSLISCQSQVKYIRVPMSSPPEKYFILDYNSKNSFELEHINSLKKILEWQSWYNIQVKSNYFNYSSNEVYNYYSNKSDFYLNQTIKNKPNSDIQTIQKIEKGTFLRSVIDCKIERKYKVPTQKPQELLRRLILLTSNENDIILDPFCGSGSLGLAAKQIDRDFILIEKDEEYYNIAKQNIEEYLNNSLFK